MRVNRQPRAYLTQKSSLETKFAKDTPHQAVFTLRKSAAKVKSERRIDYRQMTVGLLLNSGGVSNKEKSRSARNCLAWVAKNQPVASGIITPGKSKGLNFSSAFLFMKIKTAEGIEGMISITKSTQVINYYLSKVFSLLSTT